MIRNWIVWAYPWRYQLSTVQSLPRKEGILKRKWSSSPDLFKRVSILYKLRKFGTRFILIFADVGGDQRFAACNGTQQQVLQCWQQHHQPKNSARLDTNSRWITRSQMFSKQQICSADIINAPEATLELWYLKRGHTRWQQSAGIHFLFSYWATNPWILAKQWSSGGSQPQRSGGSVARI